MELVVFFKENMKLLVSILLILIGLYLISSNNRLPDFVGRLFQNPIFQIIVLTMVIYHVDKRSCCDNTGAILIIISFLIILSWIHKQNNEDTVQAFFE